MPNRFFMAESKKVSARDGKSWTLGCSRSWTPSGRWSIALSTIQGRARRISARRAHQPVQVIQSKAQTKRWTKQGNYQQEGRRTKKEEETTALTGLDFKKVGSETNGSEINFARDRRGSPSCAPALGIGAGRPRKKARQALEIDPTPPIWPWVKIPYPR